MDDDRLHRRQSALLLGVWPPPHRSGPVPRPRDAGANRERATGLTGCSDSFAAVLVAVLRVRSASRSLEEEVDILAQQLRGILSPT